MCFRPRSRRTVRWRETLQRYEDLSKHLNVVYKDPAKSPNFYQQYTDSAPSQNSMIVGVGREIARGGLRDIYEYSYDYSTYSSLWTVMMRRDS